MRPQTASEMSHETSRRTGEISDHMNPQMTTQMCPNTKRKADASNSKYTGICNVVPGDELITAKSEPGDWETPGEVLRRITTTTSKREYLQGYSSSHLNFLAEDGGVDTMVDGRQMCLSVEPEFIEIGPSVMQDNREIGPVDTIENGHSLFSSVKMEFTETNAVATMEDRRKFPNIKLEAAKTDVVDTTDNSGKLEFADTDAVDTTEYRLEMFPCVKLEFTETDVFDTTEYRLEMFPSVKLEFTETGVVDTSEDGPLMNSSVKLESAETDIVDTAEGIAPMLPTVKLESSGTDAVDTTMTDDTSVLFGHYAQNVECLGYRRVRGNQGMGFDWFPTDLCLTGQAATITGLTVEKYVASQTEIKEPIVFSNTNVGNLKPVPSNELGIMGPDILTSDRGSRDASLSPNPDTIGSERAYVRGEPRGEHKTTEKCDTSKVTSTCLKPKKSRRLTAVPKVGICTTDNASAKSHNGKVTSPTGKKVSEKKRKQGELSEGNPKKKAKKRHVCNICEKALPTPFELKRHTYTHTGEKPFKCKDCDKAFSQASRLKTHCLRHKGEQPYECNICKKTFSDQSNLAQHKVTHSSEKPHVCDICNKAFKRPSHLRRHRTSHTDGECYTCHTTAVPKVGICTTDNASAKSHNGRVTSPTGKKVSEKKRKQGELSEGNPKKRAKKRHVCNICEKALPTPFELKRHTYTHTGEKPFKCKDCDKAFSQASRLKTHCLRHKGEQPYECNICKKTFSDQSNLAQHKVTHSSEKPHVCDICNKAFKRPSHLRRHRTSHTDGECYTCHTCNKTFKYLDSLKAHLLVHSGDAPYHCDICLKNFSHLGNLKVHKFIHLKQKPHGCEICNKSFGTRYTLNKHLLIHSGEKRHFCHICHKGFLRRNELKNHEVIHTSESPYKCNVCNKFFRELGTLRKHKKSHQ